MSGSTTVLQKPSMQLLLITLLCIISALLFSLIATVLVVFLYGFDLHSFNDYNNPTVIEGLKLFQLLTAVGLFIVPPIVFEAITTKKPFSGLMLTHFSKPINWILVVFLMVVSAPFMSWLVEINSQMTMPEFFAPLENWMKQSEQSAEELTKLFLTFHGIGSFLYIMLIVAVVPAFGEEMLFRGVLQKIFVKTFKNYHIAIWVTAILFSALHMQFYGFLPRMLLGAMFGYVFYWSRSLWLPILGHFLNNGSVVVLSYFYPEMMNNTEVTFFEGEISWVLSFVSAILVVVGLVIFKKIESKKIVQQD